MNEWINEWIGQSSSEHVTQMSWSIELKTQELTNWTNSNKFITELII